MFGISLYIRRYHFHNLLEFDLTLWAIEKKAGGLRINFSENPSGISGFFSLPLEIPDKTRLYPAKKFHKIVLHPSEPILVNVNKSLENPLAIFFQYPWKFHILNPILLTIAS